MTGEQRALGWLRRYDYADDIAQVRADERVFQLDAVCKWLDRNGYAEAAKAVFGERLRFFLAPPAGVPADCASKTSGPNSESRSPEERAAEDQAGRRAQLRRGWRRADLVHAGSEPGSPDNGGKEAMTRRRDDECLRAKWSKRERDLSFGWPSGVGVKPDAHMLYGIFAYEKVYDGRTFVEELKRRGYDVSTLLFSVKKDPKHPRWADEHRPRQTGPGGAK